MTNKYKGIIAVDIYLEKRKSHEYVGRLTRSNSYFIFTYSDSYIYKDKAISLGPDLPLSEKNLPLQSYFHRLKIEFPQIEIPLIMNIVKWSA